MKHITVELDTKYCQVRTYDRGAQIHLSTLEKYELDGILDMLEKTKKKVLDEKKKRR